MKKDLPTVSIKGNPYVLVKDRLVAFQELFPKGSITTEILTNDNKSVVAKATVKPDEIRTFTGHSEAYRQGNMGNVPVEVAETSAVGRALAFLGIGIIESVASADEIVKASYTQESASGSTIQPRLGNKAGYPLKPASEKQKAFIKKLHQEKNIKIPSEKWFNELDMSMAKATIDTLLKDPGLPIVTHEGDEDGYDDGERNRLDEANEALDAEGQRDRDYGYDK